MSSALVESKEDLPTREAKKSTDSEFDRIYKYFHSKSRIELTAGEQQVMERWEKAWFLLLRNRTRNQTSQILVKLFNISRSTAYDDVRNAMNLFSDPREDMKAAKRAIAEDNLLKGAEKAWKTGNLEMHLKYMDKYAEINGLKEEGGENNLADLLKNFKPQQIIMNFKVEDLKAEAEKMREIFAQEIPYESVE
jgi:hypothetical protein